MNKQQLISLDEACEILTMARSQLISMLEEKSIVIIDDNGEPKIQQDDLQRLQESSTEFTKYETFQEEIMPEGTNSEEITDAKSEEMLDLSGSQVRDRIVVLGRRRSGKTVFITRLYEQLWNSRGNFHMKALSGNTHKHFMHLAYELKEGRWIAATNETTYADLEITEGEISRLMVAVDYPGELFTAAFVEGSSREDAKELIQHVDRASAVIILLSPDIKINESVDETIDDNFGMQKAIEYIRKSPGGDSIPIAVVVTKMDQYKSRIRRHGGLKKFLEKHYLPLLRVIHRYRPFLVAAIQTKEVTRNGKTVSVPSFDSPPVNLIDPIKWCWDKISATEHDVDMAQKLKQFRAHERETIEEYSMDRKRAAIFWALFWSVALIVGVLIAVITFELV